MAGSEFQGIAAGRATDLLIAEKVFGKRPPAGADPYREDANPMPFYTTNDKDALELLEAVFEKFHPAWRQTADGRYQVMNYEEGSGLLLPGWSETDGPLAATADTLALAIARFVLLWQERAGGGK